MGKKKPFVDKNKSSTYHLLHRSQRDVASDVLLEQGDTAAAGMILYPSPDNLASTDQVVLATPQQASTMAAWRDKLAAAGLLQEDPDRYMKPISGTGTFLSANGMVGGDAVVHDARSRALEENLLEVDRQFDSIPLTADFMDEEIAQALFGDFDEDAFEELNDDFMLEAAKEPEGSNEQEGAFDYDEHIRKLMGQAKREREGGEQPLRDHAWGSKDTEFFSGVKRLDEHEDEDDCLHSKHPGTTPGVVPALSPEQERILCEKFEEALAEYDSDEVGDCPEEEIVGPLPMEGDAQVEAALEEFLYDRKDEIFMQGSRHYLTGVKHGGSGFSALVGKQMVHAKELDGFSPTDPVEPLEEILAEAKERLAIPPSQPPPEEILIDGKSYFSEKERNPFDCESVLSTYSNLDNNPITIEASRRRRNRKNRSVTPVEEEEQVQPIRLSNKTGLPLGVLPTREMEDFDDTIVSVNKGVARNRKETAEEKKARKEAVKLERQMARIQKTATKEVFKEEFQKRSMEVGVDDVAGRSVFRYS